MPTVSVIIPTHNRAAYIMDALESVWAQSYLDYEIIIVDDGSTDHTAEVLEPLSEDGKIRYVFQENQGESAARNHGIRLATGKYIAFLDSDDLFLPLKFEKQVMYLDQHPDVGLVHSWYGKFDDDGNDLGVRNTSKFSGWFYPQILMEWSILMAVPCIMVPKVVLDEVGEFDEEQFWGPDLDMWRRIARRFAIGVIPEVLSKIRVHPGNVSANKAQSVKWFERYLKKAFADDPNLGWVFRRRCLSKMYCNVGDNLLSSKNPQELKIVRGLYWHSIWSWALYYKPYLGLVGTILPTWIRVWMYRIWLNQRYKSLS